MINKHTKENVFKSTLEYFNGDELATDVWIKKYCLKDENYLYELNPDQMHRRLAKEIARIESKYPNPLSEEEIYETLKNFTRIVLQGSPMSGIGNDFQIVSLSNCFVIGNENKSDSYGGIMKLDQEMVQLQKRRGGVGLDLSFIRPTGSPVKNSAITSTGVVPFMERYSNSTKEVAQDGRRGALMESISIKHPDAEKFIDAKLTEGKVTGANVSIKLHDDFMRTALNDNNNDYLQSYPIDLENVSLDQIDKYDEIITVTNNEGDSVGYIKKIDAKRIWNKIIHNAWKSAEPGVLFWDKIISESIPDCYKEFGFGTTSTNPCFHPNTLIETVKGRIPIKDITSPIEVYSMDENNKLCIRKASASFISKKNAKTLKITLKNGNNIQVTPEHKLYVHEKGWVEAQDIKEGDRIVHLVRNRRGKRYHGVKLTTQHYRDFIMEHHLVYNGVKGEFDTSTHSIHHKDGDTHNNSIDNLECMLSNEHNRYTALNDNPQTHQIRNENGKFVSTGIKATPKISNVPDHLKTNLRNKYYHSVVSITEGEITDVYDIQVDDTHCLIANNMVAHNCGEIPLCPYDSCRLTVLNLYGYVVNPFTENAYFDWDLFKKDVIKAQRYMDDIIDLEIEKIDKIIEKIDSDPEDEFIKIYEKNLWIKIKEMTIKGRRTGLGVTAEGDMLAALGLTYGTDEGNDFCVEVHKTLKLEAYRSSVIMAKERGAFPVYNSELEDNNPFINRIKNEDIDLYTMMQKYGRRNIALLTIAPTGTTSLMTQTTSGIEPVFLPAYMRRRKINPQEKNVRVDFVDSEGQSWMEYPVFHHKFETWLKIKGYNIEEVKNMTKTQLDEIVKTSPYYKATSNDVDWVKKVEMQGRIQEHVDHSISVTVNLPKDTTEEIVAKVYETGWRSGCKGLTIYRDGCRSGVLISNKSDNKKNVETFSDNHAPKRPKRLKGEIHRFQNNLEKWIAVVGIKDGRPYELFTGRLQNGLSELPISIKECEVVKKVIIDKNGKKLKRYDIEYVDANGNKQVYEGINKTFNPEFWNYAKLISGILRHGMPLVKALELIESLSFSEEHINSWKNGVIRVIKRYIKDGEKSKGECPVCGGEDFEFKEGCLMCTGCGFSKCS